MAAAWILITAAVGVLLTPVQTAVAADLSIPIDTAIEGGVGAGGEASLLSIATADLQGRTCAVRAVRRDGQVDTNVGNDLVVSSGVDRVTLADVEREPNAVTEGGRLTLGSTISVTLVMGTDERFAAAIDLEFDCAAESASPSPTTDATPGAVTTDASSPAPSSSTSDDSPLPTLLVIGGALVVLGATAFLIRWQRDQRASQRIDDERP